MTNKKDLHKMFGVLSSWAWITIVLILSHSDGSTVEEGVSVGYLLLPMIAFAYLISYMREDTDQKV